ncbi:MAG TPA: FIST C-terminal domain-containing protein, partial [Bdellovibrionales bacterium]|nr:FIST C-terminal domain-containing protein [Bdellovibrionales bacterium]
KRTWVLHNGTPKSNIVTAVGFYGDRLRFTHGSQGGWNIFGPERRITKSRGNILYELDGRPALDLYKEYLGEKAAGLPSTALLFPLQVRRDRGNSAPLVRTILSVNEAEKSMTFAGDVPQGYLAQLMRANFDRLVDGAASAAQTAAAATVIGPGLTIAISCVGRRLVLGERVEEEVESTLANMPENFKQVGFYSYGEISPYVSGAGCELHNQTMTLTSFAEVA